jgi:hypothetical protein
MGRVSSEQIVGRHNVLGWPVEVQRITWAGDSGLSFDVLDGKTGACLTEESLDQYPTAEQLEDAVRAHPDSETCFHCRRGTGPGYHSVTAAATPTYCCDACWDERLR